MANKNTKSVKRGAPRKEFKLPNVSKMTITDILEANKNIRCRLTVYTRVGELVKNKVLKKTRETRPTGTAGKPATVFVRYSTWEKSQKTRKPQAKVTPETPAQPVTAEATPVTA